MKSDAGCRTASTLVGAAPASACAWASVGSSTPGRGGSGAASVSIAAPVTTSDAAPSAAPLKNSRRPATDHLLNLAVEQSISSEDRWGDNGSGAQRHRACTSIVL